MGQLFIDEVMDIKPAIRKIDAKGRVILPLKGVDEVFIIKKGNVFFVSGDSHALEETLEKIADSEKIEKLQSLKEWFNLIDEAELTNLTAREVDQTLRQNLSEKYLSFIEGQDID